VYSGPLSLTSWVVRVAALCRAATGAVYLSTSIYATRETLGAAGEAVKYNLPAQLRRGPRLGSAVQGKEAPDDNARGLGFFHRHSAGYLPPFGTTSGPPLASECDRCAASRCALFQSELEREGFAGIRCYEPRRCDGDGTPDREE
jgi:hypothetical protein